MKPDLKKYKRWLEFLEETHRHFQTKGYCKVKTPVLVSSPAMESSLKAYELKDERTFLPTSPEFSLKKLWFSGLADKLYELAPSFRKEEWGDLHLKEFTMLEFYIAHQDLDFLSEELLSYLKIFLGSDLEISCLSLPQCFLAFTGFELAPDSDEEHLKKVLDFHGISYASDYSWSDLYHLIYLNLMEPLLSQEALVVLCDYPPRLSALARLNSEGWAERREFFYKGVELANAYDELIDPKEMKERWKAEGNAHPLDEDLMQVASQSAIKSGVGVALGLERLFALIEESKGIKVWPFE